MAEVDLMYGADPNGFWNPQTPNLDPNTGQYSTPPPQTIQPMSQDTGRWSLQLHNKPSWVNASNEAWAKSLYDNPDPNYAGQQVQQYLSGLRAGPGKTDEGDAEALARMGQSGGARTPTAMPGFQFDDPYTKMLEGIAQSQMGEVRSNPGLNQLTQFLQKQFGELSAAPGFSPDELAVLRTQAFEPIEELRGASKRRALERTSMRGMLPSSGLNELDMRDIDIAADKSRAAAGRDLAIHAIDRRDADLSRAGQIASQLGLQIPGQQRGEELALASLLYDLPRKALQDALAVTQGSPTANDLFSQAVRLAATNQQNQLINQNKWSQLATLLAGFDF
jgi:hypothetical protein